MTRPRHGRGERADQFFQALELKPRIVMESNDTHLIKVMVEYGYGIGFLPDWSVQNEIQERRIVVLRTAGIRLRQKIRPHRPLRESI
jgi:DNA-binding transcriptional LysR family regulator